MKERQRFGEQRDVFLTKRDRLVPLEFDVARRVLGKLLE
jgi:hypothetical protein